MKKLVAVLTLAVATMSAHAEMIAYASNRAGGRIVLTQRECPKTGHVAFLTDDTGTMRDTGCWDHAKPFYVVTWNSNSAVKWYNDEGFDYTDLGKTQ